MADLPLHAQTVFTLRDLLRETQGRWVGAESLPEQAPLTVSTDTRTIGPGACFVPLVGEKFNGHDYLVQAFAQGAEAALVNDEAFERHPEWTGFSRLIVVDDTLKAYLRLGRCHRRRMNPKVVAITGSSGKTTTKELMYAGLGACLNAQKTEKNFNNEVGLTQTLLSIQPGCQVLVAEMGMRGLHQIDLLSHYAEPDVAVVVNVGPAHIGLLGSMENIARAKCEIFSGLDPVRGVGIVNGDDALLGETAQSVWSGALVKYSQSEVSQCETTGEAGIGFTYQGVRVQLALPGRHNISNALAVLKTAEALGVPLEKVASGLSAYRPESGRWHKTAIRGAQDGWVINDAYNANPASMKAALETFLTLNPAGFSQDGAQWQRILVLGAMNELGARSQEYHQELGRWLSSCKGVTGCFFIGPDARWAYEAAASAPFPVFFAENVQEAIVQLGQAFSDFSNTLMLLKGSRTFALEGVVDWLNRADCSKLAPQLTPPLTMDALSK